jgi:Flp pilus assembly protein TadG
VLSSLRTSEEPSSFIRAAGRRLREHSGQALVFVTIAMIPLIGFVGLVADLGHAYYGQRALQASADAAALAGAVKLPDAASAKVVAQEYGTAKGAKNERANLSSVTETISTRCATSITGCYPHNVITVTEKAPVKTSFLRLFGVNTIDVSVKSTACGPCGGRPADIMLVFDRTLSMCMDFNGNADTNCTKLKNARTGMLTFLAAVDPIWDRVGLVTLPPATNSGSACTTPPFDVTDSRSAAWLLVSLTNQYQTSPGKLDDNSKLVRTINCLPAQGPTAYANALDEAQAELDRNGRKNVEHFIVFFTDGAANTGPSYYSMSSPYRKQPCHQGITSANNAKAKGTVVYSIGYTLNAQGGGANRCQAYSYDGPDESPSITAYQALQQIASNGNTFYNQPALSTLNTIFASVAAQITGPRLIPDNTP